MQSGRNAAESVREAAANAAASAKAGMEKSKAAAQEKEERMKTSNPAEKEFSSLGTDNYTTTGTGTATAPVDPRQPRGPVRADAPRSDSGGANR
ncbi:hypothetical protein ACOSP7_028588 [Xanthoceras sorbifolium]